MKPLTALGGHLLSAADIEELQMQTGLEIPRAVVELLTSEPLIGLRLSLTEEQDDSGLGVELRWMTLSQMVDEPQMLTREPLRASTAISPSVSAWREVVIRIS
jgi:hypothetical protein